MSPLAPLLVGALFGGLLERAGLTRHERIVGVYRLRDLAVLKFLGSALVVGAFTVQAGISLGFTSTLPVTPTQLDAQLLGGALFGVGMALVGFCPGTVVAASATGQLDALLAGCAGMLGGALAWPHLAPSLLPLLDRASGRSVTTAPRALGVSGWLLVLLLAECALIGFYAIERAVRPVSKVGRLRRRDVPGT